MGSALVAILGAVKKPSRTRETGVASYAPTGNLLVISVVGVRHVAPSDACCVGGGFFTAPYDCGTVVSVRCFLRIREKIEVSGSARPPPALVGRIILGRNLRYQRGDAARCCEMFRPIGSSCWQLEKPGSAQSRLRPGLIDRARNSLCHHVVTEAMGSAAVATLRLRHRYCGAVVSYAFESNLKFQLRPVLQIWRSDAVVLQVCCAARTNHIASRSPGLLSSNLTAFRPSATSLGASLEFTER